MTTVFDIATALLQREGGSMESVKLQKLCFYAFGWYAHLTGEPLFGETFYAMEYGPVVGELLSAHAQQKRVDLEMLTTQREARDDDESELDPYKGAVLDAIWGAYGDKSSWSLVDLTHAEAVWEQAWTARRQGTKRGDLARDDVIGYFLARSPKPEEHLDLPLAMISCASAAELEAIERHAMTHQSFLEAVETFRLVP